MWCGNGYWVRMLRILLALSLTAAPLTAQIPTPASALGPDQAPSGTRWRRVVTPHFDVIFAEGLEPDAQRVGAMLEQIHAPLGKTMGEPPKRISVVLQSQ